jgi:hypothetical protein
MAPKLEGQDASGAWNTLAWYTESSPEFDWDMQGHREEKSGRLTSDLLLDVSNSKVQPEIIISMEPDARSAAFNCIMYVP